MSPSKARSYHGPVLCLNPAESARVAEALRTADDALAVAIVEKCAATAASDPRFRTPTK